jgi:hypothetical protein
LLVAAALTVTSPGVNAVTTPAALIAAIAGALLLHDTVVAAPASPTVVASSVIDCPTVSVVPLAGGVMLTVRMIGVTVTLADASTAPAETTTLVVPPPTPRMTAVRPLRLTVAIVALSVRATIGVVAFAGEAEMSTLLSLPMPVNAMAEEDSDRLEIGEGPGVTGPESPPPPHAERRAMEAVTSHEGIGRR